MRSARTKVLILVALLGVWALIVFLRWPAAAPLRPGPAQTEARAQRTAAGGGGMPRLRTDLLKAPRAPYPADVQNIFSTPPPPAPPPPQVAGTGGPTPPPAAPPPDPFQEEAKQLRYVGFLRSGSATTAFIVRGQEVHTVPVGEMMGGRFRVLEVQDDSLLLGSPTGDKQVRLSMVADVMAAPRPPGVPR